MGEFASSDCVRESMGFATKFYTDEGNFDLTALSVEVFPIRDPMQFLDFIHANKNNPQTGFADPNAKWDFFSRTPESLNHLIRVFSPQGLPDGFRHMDGFAINTYKMVNAKGDAFLVKFHLLTQQGRKSITPA